MSEGPWRNLSKTSDLASKIGDRKVAEKVDLYLNAVMETLTETLPVAPVDVLSSGAHVAKDVLDRLSRGNEIDRLSATFIAGRVATVVDVLGYAARQTADDALLLLAQKHPYAAILDALYARPLRNVELCTTLGKDKGQVSRALVILRSHDAVVSHKDGRELYNALTPVGRLVVEAGIQVANRVPLAASCVHDLAASRPLKFDLRTRERPEHMDVGELPMLRTANG